MKCNFILFVKDQQISANFYEKILDLKPTLNVPGMTEFHLNQNCILGIMPEKGIKNILGSVIDISKSTNASPKSELYLTVESPQLYMNRALGAGAKILSELQNRNWGDQAGYVEDLDGHILVFAKNI